MKILDRYIIKSLIASYIICVFLVLCFYIIIDMFTNFDKFDDYRQSLEKNSQVKDISLWTLMLTYYFYQIPVIFYNLAPIATVMSGMFTLTRMSRCNELIPLKASGVSMYRLLSPFLIFACIIAISMITMHEYVITEIADNLETLQHMRYSTRWQKNMILHTDMQGNIFYIRTYYSNKQILEEVRVVIPYSMEKFQPKFVIKAKIGSWTKYRGEQAVLLKDGTITEYLSNGEIKDQSISIQKEGYILLTDMSDIALTQPDRKNLDKHKILRLWQILEKNPDLVSIQLTLHLRFSLPLSNILLILLGLPLILGRETRNFFLGTGICAILCGVFYGTYICCANLGFKEILTPIFAAWFPITAFGSWAAALWSWIST